MNLSEIGMCTATLLTDPMRCEGDTFSTCVRASAAAGFTSVALWPFHAASLGFDASASLIHDLGLRVGAVEAAFRWVEGDNEGVRAEANALLDVADRFECRQVMACTMETTIDADLALEGFAALCKLAAQRGVRVALEFLPWSAVPTIAAAWAIVRDCTAANAGLVIDTWHWTRQPGGPDVATLRAVPGHQIHYLQVCDTAPNPTAPGSLREAMTDRRLPGTGTTDFTTLSRVLEAIGAQPYVAAEVFNTQLAALGPTEMALAVRAACLSALALA